MQKIQDKEGRRVNMAILDKLVEKKDGKIKTKNLMFVRFVPFTRANEE